MDSCSIFWFNSYGSDKILLKPIPNLFYCPLPCIHHLEKLTDTWEANKVLTDNYFWAPPDKTYLQLFNSMLSFTLFLPKWITRNVRQGVVLLKEATHYCPRKKYFHYIKYGLSKHPQIQKSNSKLNMNCQHSDKLLVVLTRDLYRPLSQPQGEDRQGSWQLHSGEKKLSEHSSHEGDSVWSVCVWLCVCGCVC